MEWWEIIVVVLLGIPVGIINTLAGSGSVVTLSLFTNLLGIPEVEANATNRLGVLVQTLVGVLGFHRSGVKVASWDVFLWLALPALPGAAIGATLASLVSNQVMSIAILVMMCLVLCTLFFDFKKLLKPSDEEPDVKRFRNIIICFFLGLYIGFLQAGVGIILLMYFVPVLGFNLNRANAEKSFFVLILTVPILLLFIYQGQIHWLPGLLVALGQSLGVLLAVRFAVHHPDAETWIRRLLILVIVGSALRIIVKAVLPYMQ